MRPSCDGDDVLRAHTTLVRILKGKMTLQTQLVIHQNDRQKVRSCGISSKNDMQEMWKKLWFFEEKR